jgi:hypothetical protein
MALCSDLIELDNYNIQEARVAPSARVSRRGTKQSRKHASEKAKHHMA